MKFVAKSAFHNAPELGLTLDSKAAGYVHASTIPKGHRFEIAPDAKALKGVTKEAEKQIIAKLVMFDLVAIDDGTPESADAIKKIDAEVEADKKATAKAEAAKPLSVADQIALGVAQALAQIAKEGKK